MNDKRRDQIGSVKPLSMPIFDRIDQVVIKKLDFETLAKLNPATAEGTGFLTAGLRFQAKEKAKKREKEGSQGRLHKDEQKQKDGEQHWGLDGSD